jgi:hypothetical protein
MLRRNQLITTAALALACSLPASAAMAQQDLRMPDTRDTARQSEEAPPPSSIAALERERYQDLRMPDRRDAAGGGDVTETPAAPRQDLRSPDARDAARDLPPVQVPAPIVEVREASRGFDWGDAGIGAAGMLALLSIAAGSTLVITGRRRRRGLQMAAH